jgi:hypothetical protein
MPTGQPVCSPIVGYDSIGALIYATALGHLPVTQFQVLDNDAWSKSIHDCEKLLWVECYLPLRMFM